MLAVFQSESPFIRSFPDLEALNEHRYEPNDYSLSKHHCFAAINGTDGHHGDPDESDLALTTHLRANRISQCLSEAIQTELIIQISTCEQLVCESSDGAWHTQRLSESTNVFRNDISSNKGDPNRSRKSTG